MTAQTRITAKRLRELLRYEPDTGIFTWLQTRGRMAKAGQRAGCVTCHGYCTIGVDGRNYFAHRLAWLYMTGEWPSLDIDHRDTNSLNNRWANLREATEHENLQNQRRAHRTNKCGLLGVSPNKRGWQASIRIDGKDRHLGTFTTPDEAHQAYVEAKRAHHPGCTI